jgi:hypothetical protein
VTVHYLPARQRPPLPSRFWTGLAWALTVSALFWAGIASLVFACIA